jgi:hypothetical protein
LWTAQCWSLTSFSDTPRYVYVPLTPHPSPLTCAQAQVTRWAPPQPMNHLLTTYHISTSTSTWPPLTSYMWTLINLQQCPFQSNLCRLRLIKVPPRKRRPSRQRQPQQHGHCQPHPTPLPNHYRPTHQHPPTPHAPCPYTTPGISEAGTRVRAPGGSSTHAPSAPTPRVRVEGAYFALGPSYLQCHPQHSNTPDAKKSPLHPHPFGWGQRGRL